MNAARRDSDIEPPAPADSGRPPAKVSDKPAAPRKPAWKEPSSVEFTVIRRAVYGLFIALSIGGVVGRILAVDSIDKQVHERALYNQGRPDWMLCRPFLSANDRSRWATVRSLVEENTYAIDNIVAQPLWDTIDMVRHKGRDGKEHLYSSKPPLLATLMAVPYWFIYEGTNWMFGTSWTLGEHAYELGRALLILYNVPLLLVYFLILASLAERFGVTTWGRLLMMAAATGGTFLTTYAVSVTNHLPAAAAAAAVLWSTARIILDGERRWWWFAIDGLAAGFAFACELPALSLLALVAGLLLWLAPRPALAFFLPAALLVVAAEFGTNYVAHRSFRVPYAHRSETDPEDNWYRFTYVQNGRQYTSYWSDPKGVDRGEPSAGWYAFHALIGHHGVLSLTPIWVLSLIGFGFWIRSQERRALAGAIGFLTIVCLAFYLSRPQLDRNYGGMTSGLRWMFWFAPLWLVLLLPAADWLAVRRWGRGIAFALLGFSALSASYPTWNPWQEPWIERGVEHWRWLNAKDQAESASLEPSQPPGAIAIP